MEEVTQLLSCQPTRPVVNGDPRRTKDSNRLLHVHVLSYVARAGSGRIHGVLHSGGSYCSG